MLAVRERFDDLVHTLASMDEVFVRTLISDPALVKHEHMVAVLHDGGAVRNDYHGAFVLQREHRLLRKPTTTTPPR